MVKNLLQPIPGPLLMQDHHIKTSSLKFTDYSLLKMFSLLIGESSDRNYLNIRDYYRSTPGTSAKTLESLSYWIIMES